MRIARDAEMARAYLDFITKHTQTKIITVSKQPKRMLQRNVTMDSLSV